MAASKKATTQVEQKPILTEEQTASKVKTTVKSRRRTSLSEFAAVKNLRPEITAGFKAWLKNDLFHFDEEWDELFNKYINRTL